MCPRVFERGREKERESELVHKDEKVCILGRAKDKRAEYATSVCDLE